MPAASAGASFHAASISGEFQGVIAAMTPSGSSRVKLNTPGLSIGNDAAFDLVGEAAEIIEPLRDVIELAAHLGDELAVIGGLDLGEMRGLGRDEIAELAQQRAAGAGGQAAPALVAEGLVRGIDGGIHIGHRAARNLRPGGAEEGILRFECLAAGGLDPASADEHLIFVHGLFLPAHWIQPDDRTRSPRAQSLPLPWGEGWGEGVRTIRRGEILPNR